MLHTNIQKVSNNNKKEFYIKAEHNQPIASLPGYWVTEKQKAKRRKDLKRYTKGQKITGYLTKEQAV